MNFVAGRLMKMGLHLFGFLTLCVLQFPTFAYAQDITRNISGVAFVDHDFITLHRQGNDLIYKSSNPYDFITHSDTSTPFHPAPFEYSLTFPQEGLDQCALNIIAWGRPVGIGESARGFLGRITSDKSVFTGDGNFRVTKSLVPVNYAIDNGRPPNRDVWEEIILTSAAAANIVTITDAEARILWGNTSYTPYITGGPAGQSAKWITRSGPPDDFYSVYSVPCSALINVPPVVGKLPTWTIPAIMVLLGLGIGAFLWLRPKGPARKTNSSRLSQVPAKFIRPSKPLERPENAGVIFPASPMLAGNVAAPLAPAGQLAAAQLQMLTGPYSVLREAYQATGRIGYAQEGLPTAEDYSFGTGFLISDRHVVTNRHVHGLYGHYLLDKTDPGGIEFIAEKGKDTSDFVPFNGEPPLLLPELDIAIYTLARAVTDRTPLTIIPSETDNLLEREIVIIGYPDTHSPDNPDVLAVVEDDPVFAVKRLSQGKVFRHSTDTNTPLGVETFIAETKSSKFLMPAICHNASTMGGNSGSPLLDIRTGQLVGVHFAGFKVFNQKEAANLAMAIAQLSALTAVTLEQT